MKKNNTKFIVVEYLDGGKKHLAVWNASYKDPYFSTAYGSVFHEQDQIEKEYINALKFVKGWNNRRGVKSNQKPRVYIDKVRIRTPKLAKSIISHVVVENNNIVYKVKK